MGEHTAFRIRVFKSAFDAICQFINESESKAHERAPLPPQLGVTQQNLHKWTLEEYSTEARRLLKEFEPLAREGLNSLQQAKRLSNSVHHFAHALEHRLAHGDADLANKLRIQCFELLLYNLEQKRKDNAIHKEKTGRILQDWPELLKNVAEAGQNIIQLGDVRTRRSVAGAVMKLLNDVFWDVRPLLGGRMCMRRNRA